MTHAVFSYYSSKNLMIVVVHLKKRPQKLRTVCDKRSVIIAFEDDQAFVWALGKTCMCTDVIQVKVKAPELAYLETDCD